MGRVRLGWKLDGSFLRRSQPGCGGGVKTRVLPFGEGPGLGEEPGRKVGMGVGTRQNSELIQVWEEGR